jgi:hypothetical protein
VDQAEFSKGTYRTSAVAATISRAAPNSTSAVELGFGVKPPTSMINKDAANHTPSQRRIRRFQTAVLTMPKCRMTDQRRETAETATLQVP